ncbi:hypothetical protein Ancab_032076 [Ancistrocladus abbreviatus]
MHEDMNNPWQNSSVQDSQVLSPDIANLSKKRKFLAEATEILGLPPTKHKCYDTSLTAECDSLSTKTPEAEDSHMHIDKGKAIMGVLDAYQEVNSAQDSNSYVGDSSLCAETKLGVEHAKMHCHEASVSCSERERTKSVHYLPDTMFSSTAISKVQPVLASRDPFPAYEDVLSYGTERLEEHNHEFGNPPGYIWSEYGPVNEHPTYDELDDFIYSDEVNPDISMLPSQGWSVNRGDLVFPFNLSWLLVLSFEHLRNRGFLISCYLHFAVMNTTKSCHLVLFSMNDLFSNSKYLPDVHLIDNLFLEVKPLLKRKITLVQRLNLPPANQLLIRNSSSISPR